MVHAVARRGLDSAELVAWVCLVVGVLLVGAGVYHGWMTATQGSSKTKERLARARAAVEEADEELARGRAVASAASRGGQGESLAAGEALTQATGAAKGKTEAAKSALEQVGGIVASLPENLRFAGLLVLVGAVLMSVATVQFGGTSLF